MELILNQLYVFLQRGKYGNPNFPEMGNKTTIFLKKSSGVINQKSHNLMAKIINFICSF
jgi:hypothetical protein